jgi:hypothetical protein
VVLSAARMCKNEDIRKEGGRESLMAIEKKTALLSL